MSHTLRITGDDAADELISRDPLALLIGMLLDQQVTMEAAFSGPERLRSRLGGLDAATIAGMDPEQLADACRRPPAVHRYPAAMAGRIQALCTEVAERWHGDAAAIWTDGAPDGPEVLRRLRGLPGFGEQKASIFLALLGKQLGLSAAGWREAAGEYGEAGSFRSVADIVDPESLAKVREHKRAAKAAGGSRAGRPARAGGGDRSERPAEAGGGGHSERPAKEGGSRTERPAKGGGRPV